MFIHGIEEISYCLRHMGGLDTKKNESVNGCSDKVHHKLYLVETSENSVQVLHLMTFGLKSRFFFFSSSFKSM